MATRHPARRPPPVSIAVLGSANMDLVVRQPRLPRPGETLFGSSFTAVPGGKGLNQAVTALDDATRDLIARSGLLVTAAPSTRHRRPCRSGPWCG
ncbi:hypothetical protein Franean1_3758 [Parafrankia sp. EAN1pec]|nr:hypothetical protein Franean1_3758 [Frankia sp. EAN1pec]